MSSSVFIRRACISSVDSLPTSSWDSLMKVTNWGTKLSAASTTSPLISAGFLFQSGQDILRFHAFRNLERVRGSVDLVADLSESVPLFLERLLLGLKFGPSLGACFGGEFFLAGAASGQSEYESACGHQGLSMLDGSCGDLLKSELGWTRDRVGVSCFLVALDRPLTRKQAVPATHHLVGRESFRGSGKL